MRDSRSPAGTSVTPPKLEVGRLKYRKNVSIAPEVLDGAGAAMQVQSFADFSESISQLVREEYDRLLRDPLTRDEDLAILRRQTELAKREQPEAEVEKPTKANPRKSVHKTGHSFSGHNRGRAASAG